MSKIKFYTILWGTILLFGVGVKSWGQSSETFTNQPASNASYLTRTWTGDNGGTWTATVARTDQTITGAATCFKDKVTSNSVSGGCGTLSFKHKIPFAETSPILTVWVNGTQYGGSITPTSTATTANITVNVSGSVIVEIRSNGTFRIAIDDISWTAYAAGPTLTASTSTFTALNYIQGAGPSASQTYNLSGTNLTGFPSNITVTGSTNYEVSTNNSSFAASVTVAYSSATLAATPIYMRLKAGLSAANYNSETISNAGGGATTVNVTCSGTVTAPTPVITVSPTTLTGFTYIQGSGPSASQSYALSAVNLTGAPSNLTLTGPTNYEISTDNTTFAGTLSIAYATATLSSTTIYVRLKSGLTVGSYNAQTISNAGGGATTVNVTCSGTVTAAPVVNSALTASGIISTAFTYTITGTNTPTSYNATGLPAGLSINTSTGVISGTPTATGTTNVTISATNASGTGTATLVITISNPPAPAITSSLSSSGSTGSAYSYTITASNTPTSYNATGLPAGLSINTSTGVISGTPTATGVTNVTISATNAGGTGTATLVITVTSFTYASGDWRTTVDGAGLAFNGYGWESFNGTSWTTQATAPQNVAAGSAPTRIIIEHLYIDAGDNTGLNGSRTFQYNDIIIRGGGELDLYDNKSTGSLIVTWNPFIATGKKIQVMSGGILNIEGDFDMGSSTRSLILEDGATMYLNQPTMTNAHCMWLGTEDIKDNSTIVVQDWSWGASPTVASFLNPTYQIPTNSSGGGYRIGNLTYNCTPSADYTILPALSSTLLFCNSLTITNLSTTSMISLTANKVSTPVATVGGNVTVYEGKFNFGINYTTAAIQKLTVLGNIDIQYANSSNPSTVNLHNFGTGSLTLFYMELNLYGNLSVATGATLSSGPTSDASWSKSWLKFLGTNAQTVNGAGTISLCKAEINKSSNQVTLNRNFTLEDTLKFTLGKFVLGTYNLNLGKAATMGIQSGGSSTSYVVTNSTGVYKRFQLSTSTAHNFPIGPSTTSYNPAVFNYTGTVDDITARVEVGLNPTTGFDAYFVNRTWDISEVVAGGTTASLSLQWEVSPTTHENASFARATSNMYHYTGGAWVEETGSTLGGSDPYTCTHTGLTSFSPRAVGKAGILPIELLDFNAKAKSTNVTLTWTTASEINNDYFTIERSKDAENFEFVTKVKGAGNSNKILSYNTIDFKPFTGKSYYRLKQTDFDGKYTYSEIRAVNFNGVASTNISIYKSYEGQLNIETDLKDEVAIIEIYDVAGRLVFDKQLTLNNGNATLPFNPGAEGMYIVKLVSGTNLLTQKIIY